MFGKGQLLDADEYFVLPDDIGLAGSTPSDGLKARLPRYGYSDMVEAQYRRLAEGLGVDHPCLVMGTFRGIHTWVWGERHPQTRHDAAATTARSRPRCARPRRSFESALTKIQSAKKFL